MRVARLMQMARAGLPIDRSWNVSYASYDYGDAGRFDVSPQDTNPTGLSFKPDGLKMYFIGLTGDNVYEYNLSTAWEISTASYVQGFNIQPQETNPQALFFKDDGTKMYVIGLSGDDVNEYSLSTAWDISTASYVHNFSVTTEESSPQGLFFKPDGTKMYVIGYAGDDVNEYSLSTAWDVSTASYVQLFSVSAQETLPQDLFFKPDGTKMYVVGSSGDDVNEYSLSTAWDVSTASYVQNFKVSTQDSTPTSLFFKPDGTKMYVAGTVNDAVNEYSLSTAWDVSTASWDAPTSGYFSFVAQESIAYGIFFKPDGTKMYVVGRSSNAVNEYSLSTAWEVSTASYVQLFSINAQESSVTGLSFKPDGTKMYVVGASGDEVNEYSLSTAWDISTASFIQLFSVFTQESNPQALFFKPDGTTMYVIGLSSDNVNEYSLSTAWDISTASYVQLFSVSAQEGNSSSLFFKDDGLKMYVMGVSGDDVNEYNLSTAWDVSTASYVHNFSVSTQETNPQDLFFKPDGLTMYVIGGDAVWEYNIG